MADYLLWSLRAVLICSMAFWYTKGWDRMNAMAQKVI